jgi:hypothetical protein
MEIISPGWFIWHALVGIAIGYALRLFEHAVWRSMQHEQTGSMFGFAMLIIPPLLVVGATLGYISVVLSGPCYQGWHGNIFFSVSAECLLGLLVSGCSRLPSPSFVICRRNYELFDRDTMPTVGR